jgi:hypothetical protein
MDKFILPKNGAVHSSVKCCDTLLQIAGRSFLGVPTSRCEIPEDSEIEIIDGPVTVKDSEGEMTEVVKVRHRMETGRSHEGWIPFSYLK